MGAVYSHRGHSEADTASASVSALVTQMQAELHSLIERHLELTRRIRNVHRVMRGLRELPSTPASDPLQTNPQLSPDNRTNTRRSERRQRSGLRPRSDQPSVSLQRACRIALMETQTAASLEEIYERIARRGSFAFVDIRHASLALDRVLNIMKQEGEVRLLDSGSSLRWERIPRAEQKYSVASRISARTIQR
jgi:hypothetical protein